MNIKTKTFLVKSLFIPVCILIASAIIYVTHCIVEIRATERATIVPLLKFIKGDDDVGEYEFDGCRYVIILRGVNDVVHKGNCPNHKELKQ